MITTLFFDAAGTLLHLPRGVAWHYCDVAARFGCGIEEKALARAFHSAWHSMPAREVTRQPRPDDDKRWWSDLVARVLDGCAPGEMDRTAYFEALYSEFARPGVWALYPETWDALARLRGRYRLGLISNFDGRLRTVLSHLRLDDWFDPIIISSEAGADKPDPWIFQRALALAGSTAAESVHIGDDPTCDWQGAAAAGLQVFPLRRPGMSLCDLEAFLEEVN